MPDGEETFICPYNKAHVVLLKRKQFHLTKCRKQHPDQKTRQCLFNTTHIVPEIEYEFHLQYCEDQKTVIQHLINKEDDIKFHQAPPVSCIVPPESSENWDLVNVPTYDPTEYLEQNEILRNKQNCPPSERKQFRQKERLRLAKLKENSPQWTNSVYNVSTQSSSGLQVVRRPITNPGTKSVLNDGSKKFDSISLKSNFNDLNSETLMYKVQPKEDDDGFMQPKVRGRGRTVTKNI